MWLSKLDTRASRWSRPAYWSYLFIKWNLIAMGAWACLIMGIDDFRHRRVGLGSGVIVFGFVPLAWRLLHRAWTHYRAP